MKFTLVFLFASLALCKAWQEQGVVRLTPENAINMKLYYDSYNTFVTYPLRQMSSMFNDVRFQRNRQTMVFFHGLDGHVLDTSTRAIVEAMMRIGTYNVVVFDWSYYIEGVSFPTVVPDLLKISEIAATYFNEIFPMYSVKNFYFVGFSLGAQLSGMISRMAYRKSGNQYMFPRITALDPVLPMPYVPFIKDLNENDADFVDVVHTDSSSFRIMGTVNFYPNGGSKQPSCNSTTTTTTANNNGETYMPDTMVAFFDDNCSHNKAWKYFAQGVENKRFFTAMKCDSFTDFMTGRCDPNQMPGKMGFYAETNMSGNYYLQTREEDEMIDRNINNSNNRMASSSSSSSSSSSDSSQSSSSSSEEQMRRRN